MLCKYSIFLYSFQKLNKALKDQKNPKKTLGPTHTLFLLKMVLLETSELLLHCSFFKAYVKAELPNFKVLLI